ncbi:MAG: DUF4892 domain-containing protein [Desulfobacteraceae bacterium]|nr:DUF4892 domain-containing protein [Desulfobacteraceae bacterium]
MSIKNILILCLLTGLFMPVNSTFAKGKSDTKSSKDHALISRFNGSIIRHYEVKAFDEYILPLGKFVEKDGKKPWKITKSKRELSKIKKLEGKITRIQYKAPEGRSTFEIFSNYKLALKNAGFEILFIAMGKELGRYNVWPDHLYSILNPLVGNTKFELNGEDAYQRYLSAKLSRPEGDIYVSLNISLGWNKWPVIQLDVIEVKPMETDLVKISMDALAKEIDKTGHVAVDGIYFDTNKAELKPESDFALNEIAKLLQHNPRLKLYVVGHTDSVGDLNYNRKLSQNRADSVVKKLVSDYGVDITRLKAFGVGPLVPEVSNNTEDGRKKNRRVELVEQ